MRYQLSVQVIKTNWKLVWSRKGKRKKATGNKERAELALIVEHQAKPGNEMQAYQVSLFLKSS
jgi:hypothetical protein